MSFALAELERRLANLIRVGTIQAVNPATARATVAMGGTITAPLPWLTHRAGAARTWWSPSAGEQVLVLSPGGDPAQGVILPSLYRSAHPPPVSDPAKQITVYADGTTVEYDTETHEMNVDCVGTVNITAAGTVRIEAPTTTIAGDLAVEGQVTAAGDVTTTGGDVVAGDIHLKTHKHTAPAFGGTTSTPIP